jgi:thioredoxin-like negative regulator of GroEL
MEENSGVELYTFNIEENTDFVRELGIRSVPTVKAFATGEVVFTEIGLRNTQTIMEMTKKII